VFFFCLFSYASYLSIDVSKSYDKRAVAVAVLGLYTRVEKHNGGGNSSRAAGLAGRPKRHELN
jgi:uncharacterized membrane protein